MKKNAEKIFNILYFILKENNLHHEYIKYLHPFVENSFISYAYFSQISFGQYLLNLSTLLAGRNTWTETEKLNLIKLTKFFYKNIETIDIIITTYMVNDILNFMEKKNLLTIFIEEWNKKFNLLKQQTTIILYDKKHIIQKCVEKKINFAQITKLLYDPYQTINDNTQENIKTLKNIDFKIVKYITE